MHAGRLLSTPRFLFITLALLVLGACQDRELPTGTLNPALKAPANPSELRIPATGTYTQITASSGSTCALRPDGAIDCWGIEGFPATKTAATGTFTSVSAYGSHGCALRVDGVAECWGNNFHGDAPASVTPPSGNSFVAVAAGGSHTCALRNDGTVQCWGENDGGQAPAEMAAASGSFTSVVAGGYGTCGLRDDGVVECWGRIVNAGESRFYPAPATMTATTGSYSKVFLGDTRACGIRTDGVVECYTCATVDSAPVCVTNTSFNSGATYTNVALFYSHSCAVRTDGVIECIGPNVSGQAPPTRTAATGSFTQAIVGFDFSCGLRTDGHIECWGHKTGGAYTTVLPTATFTAPASVIVGQPIVLSLSNAQVAGYSSSFTYRFNCGSGYGTSSTVSTGSCPTTAAGTRNVRGKVIDQDGDTASYSATVAIKTAAQATTDLSTQIGLASLAPDLRNALQAKLNSALSAIQKGKTSVACSAYKDFINQVTAQRGKAIPAATADAWIATVRQLQTALGC